MVIYSLVAILGATANLGLMWSIAETFNGLMAIQMCIRDRYMTDQTGQYSGYLLLAVRIVISINHKKMQISGCAPT